MKSLFALLGCALLATGCASKSTVAYSNGTIASSDVNYTYGVPPVFKTGRGIRYFVAVNGVPSWEKISISALQQSGMGRTAERERAKLVLSIDVQPFETDEIVAVPTAGGYTSGIVARAWYQIRYDDLDGVEVSGSSAEFSEVVSDPGSVVFASAEEARSASVAKEAILDSVTVRRLQERVLTRALVEAEVRAEMLFEPLQVTLRVPLIRHAAGVELEVPFDALSAATTTAEVIEAEVLYERANRQLDEETGPANATSRYGVLCGLAACRLMVDDFAGSWELTNRALELEPEGEEALAIRAGIYKEEVTTGKRAIPQEARKRMDQAAAR